MNSSEHRGYAEHSWNVKCHIIHHSSGDEAQRPLVESPNLCVVTWGEPPLSVSRRSSLVLPPPNGSYFSFIASVKSITLGLNSTINLKSIVHKRNNHSVIKIGRENAIILLSRFTISPLPFLILGPWFKIKQNTSKIFPFHTTVWFKSLLITDQRLLL